MHRVFFFFVVVCESQMDIEQHKHVCVCRAIRALSPSFFSSGSEKSPPSLFSSAALDGMVSSVFLPPIVSSESVNSILYGFIDLNEQP